MPSRVAGHGFTAMDSRAFYVVLGVVVTIILGAAGAMTVIALTQPNLTEPQSHALQLYERICLLGYGALVALLPNLRPPNRAKRPERRQASKDSSREDGKRTN